MTYQADIEKTCNGLSWTGRSARERGSKTSLPSQDNKQQLSWFVLLKLLVKQTEDEQ